MEPETDTYASTDTVARNLAKHGYRLTYSSQGGYTCALVCHVTRRSWLSTVVFTLQSAVLAALTYLHLKHFGYGAAVYFTSFGALLALVMAWLPRFSASFTLWDAEPGITAEYRRFDSDKEFEKVSNLLTAFVGRDVTRRYKGGRLPEGEVTGAEA